MSSKEEQILTAKVAARLNPGLYISDDRWCFTWNRDKNSYCTRPEGHEGPHVAIFWELPFYENPYLKLDPWFDKETNV